MKEQIKAFKEKKTYNTEDIRELVEILRSPDGCAWDREQTHKSVRNAMIEETYEFIEGLDKDDRTLMKEELGDVLFQVFFHARIAEESGNFSMDDIADEVCKKMVLRHPHVFGDVSVKNSGEVLQNWETIKKAEKSRDTLEKQLESVSSALPSLIRAEKLLSRCKKEDIPVERDASVLISRIAEKAQKLTPEADSTQIGDLLFAIINLTYALKINAEQALYETNNRFIEETVKNHVNTEEKQ
mgnify:FL=1